MSSGDLLGQMLYYGYDGSNCSLAAGIRGFVDSAPSAGATAGKIEFWTSPASGSSGFRSVMTIKSTGNVGIGTINPQNALSVNGTVQAKEVLVNTGWSDYVFAPGYRLAPLSEVAAYIRKNRHLPSIPRAAEVEKHGVNLGEMQSKLLAKIEELTLHMIRAEERSTQLEKLNRALEARLALLERSGK